MSRPRPNDASPVAEESSDPRAPCATQTQGHAVGADDGTAQAAEYIAALVGELAGIARASRLDLLAYLLEVAQLEAMTALRRAAPVVSPA